MNTLTPLYHWSLAANYRTVLHTGLQPATVSSSGQAYLACGSNPRTAWALTGADDREAREWDLWLVHLVDTDEVQILAYGPHIYEIRVVTSLPKHRVWWVGRRVGDTVAEGLTDGQSQRPPGLRTE